MTALHHIQRRYFAEDLLRRRRRTTTGATSHPSAPRGSTRTRTRSMPSWLRAAVSPTADASLADDVGLGRTIEAALVIAQLLAEGRRRILVVTPEALLGQRRQELTDLAGIDAIDVRAREIGTLRFPRSNTRSRRERCY